MPLTLSAEQLERYYQVVKPRLTTGTDWVSKEKFDAVRSSDYAITVRKISHDTYKFTRLKRLKLQSGRVVYAPTIRDRIVLEFLKDKLNDKYGTQYSNRNQIIAALRGKLSEEMGYFIIRLDIQDFFNSIPQNKLLQKLKESALLSAEEYSLVRQVIKLVPQGIPQGLPLSNALAEVYLEKFDLGLRRIHPRINFYSRYVDDILILINGTLTQQDINRIRRQIEEVFKTTSLKLNASKSEYVLFSSETRPVETSFEYLGYRFCNHGHLSISIAESKLEKLKQRINAAFADFRKNQNMPLLKERLQFLTAKNVVIKTKGVIKNNRVVFKARKIYFGAVESYRYIDSVNWDLLDRHLKMRVQSVKPLVPSRKELRELYGFSFQTSYRRNRCNRFYKYTKQDYIDKLLAMDATLQTGSLDELDIRKLSDVYFSKITSLDDNRAP